MIHIDFSEVSYKDKGLDNALHSYLLDLGQSFGLGKIKGDYKEIFIKIIKQLGKSQKTVILIDEYDKPIIDNLTDIETAEKNRDILKNFYSGIKAQDNYIQFMLVTGVSKFSRVSIFSDLNNLNDITLSPNYSTLLGYTEKEIQNVYSNYLNNLQEICKLSKEKLFFEIRKRYNGYSWDGSSFVYNPFSIISLLANQNFQNYWFSTGTPTFLVNTIRDMQIDIQNIRPLRVSGQFFDKFDLRYLNIQSILYQTGYLTIKKADYLANYYELDFPNQEVEESIVKYKQILVELMQLLKQKHVFILLSLSWEVQKKQ